MYIVLHIYRSPLKSKRLIYAWSMSPTYTGLSVNKIDVHYSVDFTEFVNVSDIIIILLSSLNISKSGTVDTYAA